MGEEVRSAQQNLRLSTGQIGRLTAEFKGMHTQNEELKKKTADQDAQIKKIVTEYENKVNILKQEC